MTEAEGESCQSLQQHRPVTPQLEKPSGLSASVQHLLECSNKGPQEKGPLGKHAGKAEHILRRDTARVGLPLGRAGRGESQDNFPLGSILLSSLLPHRVEQATTQGKLIH